MSTSQTNPSEIQLYHEPQNQLSPLGEKIFLDRYALKDVSKKNLSTGDIAVVNVDTKTGQREIGIVIGLNDHEATVQLRDGEEVTRALEHVDKPVETKVEQLMDRVARGASEVEKGDKKEYWRKRFRSLLDGWKFTPGGRILTACGSDQKLTFYNCYVIPSPVDSRDGIIKTLSHMAEIMSRGGGVGINLSTLRPRYTYVKGVNGRSSGAVSWGGLYSFVTGLIEQGGSRRGALMLILNIWHPDALEFINSKREAGKITNANISMGITDDFMQAVKEDKDWDFVFPDPSDPLYEKEWTGNLESWRKKGGKVNVHKTVKARELWNQIIESAWASAEPGVWFVDRSNKMSNSYYYKEGDLICTNPCGEQPLPAWAVCNLGHINLSKFAHNGEVRWQELEDSITTAVRFLDNVIDATPYFFEQNSRQQQQERRVGMGTIGLAEMLIKMELRYGSPEASKFIDQLYKFIAEKAYLASSDIAKEKGSFPLFDSKKFLNSGFMKQMPKEVQKKIQKDGVRNVTLLTQAPTGTTGTMIGTSTGIEPFYFWSYFRKSRLGMHEEKVSILADWQEKNPGQEPPDYFVTAMDLSPEEHVRVQAATQKWVDSAISKTCNCPNDYTVEQTKELYQLMYDLGCKGGTIYRDGSRDEQVLSLKEEDPPAEETKPQETQVKELPDSKATAGLETNSMHKVRPRPYKRYGCTISIESPSGTVHVTMNDDEQNRPFEVFVDIGKGGSDIKAMAEALGRLASLVLRVNSPLTPQERILEMVKQLGGIGGPRSRGFGKNRVRSLPDALAQALEEQYLTESERRSCAPETEGQQQEPHGSVMADLCPGCGNTSLVYTEGCQSCYRCGYSEC